MSFINKEEIPQLPKNAKVEANKIQSSRLFYDTDKCAFIFKIDGFSFLNKKHEEFITSPTFNMEQNKSIKWCLQIYPEGAKNENEISLFLKRSFTEPTELKTDVLFAIVNRENENVESFEFSHVFDDENDDWGKYCLIKKEDLLSNKKDLLPNDTLTIFCSVITHKQHIISGLRTKQLNKLDYEIPEKIYYLKSLSNLSNKNSFENMFLDETFSDITFKVDGKEIKAHKCLLAAVSPIFQTILKKDLSVSSIEVSDLSHNVMNVMLKFIYTKKVDNLHDVAHELIFAASKYNIQDLKSICEKSLCQTMNTDNVLKIVSIAIENNAITLKKLAIDLIIENKMEISQKPEFKELIELCPNLKDQLFWFLMSNHDSDLDDD